MKKVLLLLLGITIPVLFRIAESTEYSETDKQTIHLATKIGRCEATDLVFSNVQESALGLAESFTMMAPEDYKEASLSNERFLQRIIVMEKIRLNTYELISGQMMTEKKLDFNRKLFKDTKDMAFKYHLDELSSSIIFPNKKFASDLENEATACMKDFPVKLSGNGDSQND